MDRLDTGDSDGRPKYPSSTARRPFSARFAVTLRASRSFSMEGFSIVGVDFGVVGRLSFAGVSARVERQSISLESGIESLILSMGPATDTEYPRNERALLKSPKAELISRSDLSLAGLSCMCNCGDPEMLVCSDGIDASSDGLLLKDFKNGLSRATKTELKSHVALALLSCVKGLVIDCYWSFLLGDMWISCRCTSVFEMA